MIVDDGTGAFATGLGDDTIILQGSAFVDVVDNTSTATALKVKLVNKEASSVIGTGEVGVNAANTLLAISNADTTDELETVKVTCRVLQPQPQQQTLQTLLHQMLMPVR